MISLLLLNHFLSSDVVPRVEKKKKATNHCTRHGHSLWSANQLLAQGVKINVHTHTHTHTHTHKELLYDNSAKYIYSVPTINENITFRNALIVTQTNIRSRVNHVQIAPAESVDPDIYNHPQVTMDFHQGRQRLLL